MSCPKKQHTRHIDIRKRQRGKSVKNKFLFTMTAYQKAKGLLQGWGLGLKINK
jgi:hypothetical protein